LWIFLIPSSVTAQRSGLSGAAIVGIGVGVSIWLTLVIAGAAYFIYRRRRFVSIPQRPLPEHDVTPFPPPPVVLTGNGLVSNR
jgi:hypothetical protein